MRRTLLAVVLASPVVLTGCTAAGPALHGRLGVVASAYPFAWLAEQVGGPDVVVTDLVKPGAEPHDVELSPREVGTVEQAAVVIYLKGFQPAVDDALGGGKQGFDLGTVVTQQPLVGGKEATSKDPHIWLDPVRMETAATALDRLFRSSLTGCVRKDVVTSHSAFGYLAGRYGLVQRGISGLTPDAEPSPRRIAEVTDFARKNGVTTIFFESLIDPKVAKTVASEVGAMTAVLDPVEGVRSGDSYLTVQGRNAAALHTALGCA
jgi:zinc transport system substrate-binding protein